MTRVGDDRDLRHPRGAGAARSRSPQRVPTTLLLAASREDRTARGAACARASAPACRSSTADDVRARPARRQAAATRAPWPRLARRAASDPETALEEAIEAGGRIRRCCWSLDGVQDPHNLGACLRTADAAGVAAVIAPRDRAAGLTPVARKVAAGRGGGGAVRRGRQSGADAARAQGTRDLAHRHRRLRPRRSLFDADLAGPTALVLGSEGEGLRRLTRECCDQLVAIPMAGSGREPQRLGRRRRRCSSRPSASERGSADASASRPNCAPAALAYTARPRRVRTGRLAGH